MCARAISTETSMNAAAVSTKRRRSERIIMGHLRVAIRYSLFQTHCNCPRTAGELENLATGLRLAPGTGDMHRFRLRPGIGIPERQGNAQRRHLRDLELPEPRGLVRNPIRGCDSETG